ncbi:MAG: large conductance mechanosensitive channel protein MscL [Bacillota bacterium]|nr:large conductance mechanosensitive channel protein MscL [Bacillota bacterium]
MKKLSEEFKAFLLRGNVVDMAVGVIIGAAFSAIINSLVKDMLMPLISLLFGKIDFTNMFIALDGNEYATLEAAQEVGAATFNYGAFITAVINFVLIGLFVFIFIKVVNALFIRRQQEAEPEARLCPYCFGEVHEQAARCPHCCSELPEA